MAEINPGQKREESPFTFSLGFGGQYFLSPPPEGDSRVNKHEISTFMGSRFDIKKVKKIQAKFQLEWRFAALNVEIPGVFERPNSISLTQSLLFRFSTPKKPPESKNTQAPAASSVKKRVPERWGFIPSIQVGAVRRPFDIPTRVPAPEPGVGAEGPGTSPQECENAQMDNPFGGNATDCDPSQQPTVLVNRRDERWGADLIVGFNTGLKVLPQKPGKDLLNLSGEGRIRAQLAPGALPRVSARLLLGASTVFHPKVAKFLSMSVRVGPEWNLMNGEMSVFLYVNFFQSNFDTKPGGF